MPADPREPRQTVSEGNCLSAASQERFYCSDVRSVVQEHSQKSAATISPRNKLLWQSKFVDAKIEKAEKTPAQSFLSLEIRYSKLTLHTIYLHRTAFYVWRKFCAVQLAFYGTTTAIRKHPSLYRHTFTNNFKDTYFINTFGIITYSFVY